MKTTGRIQILDYRTEKYVSKPGRFKVWGIGLKLRVGNGDIVWVPVYFGDTLVTFTRRDKANEYIEEMKSERDEKGYKRQ